jgi:hypothetical protein
MGAELLVQVLPEDEGEEAPAELHPASAAAAAAATGSARSIRRRARPLLIRHAVPLPPRFRLFRVVMTSCPSCRVCQCLVGQTVDKMISRPGQPAAPAASGGSATLFSGIVTCSSVLIFCRFSWVIGAKNKHLRFADAKKLVRGFQKLRDGRFLQGQKRLA